MSQGHHAKHDSAPGSVLAAARHALNLSVNDVARHLKLSPAQVEALEQGTYERLPGRVFVRGFLRNYAKLLGIDPQPLLRSIESEMPHPAVAEERAPSAQVVMPREHAARWPLYTVLVAALIVGALAIYEFGFNESPAPPQTDAAAPAAEGDPAAAAAATATAQAPLMAPVPGAPPPGATTPVAIEGSAQGELVSSREPIKRARAGERELYLKFDEESWVEVRDRNDKVIFARLSPAGSEERMSVALPLKLVVGNARGVRVTYGDYPVNLTPHTGDTVARLTLE
jgi:cytoskeleton protein RodZ